MWYCPKNSRNNRGFTLIEAMVATALAAGLMAALLAVSTSIGRNELAAKNSTASDGQAIVDWLELDLTGAKDVTTGENSIGIAGMTALDGATRAVKHQRVTVRYAVERLSGQSWLVRRQNDGQNDRADLLFPDVEAIRLAASAASRPAMAATGPSEGQRPSKAFRLSVHFAPKNGQKDIDQLVFIR